MEALWTDVGGQAFYEAVITAVRGCGAEYEIEWEDGAEELRLQPAVNVRRRGIEGLSRTA
eukprot:COSAG05_NODE_11729_length_499_cov_3.560201_2_plen_60_part_00